MQQPTIYPRRLVIFLVVTLVIMPLVKAQPSLSERTPKEFQRQPEQTFLTFPEWFLVHSPAEFATYLKSNAPSQFPFFGHIAQLWQSYYAVYQATKDKYPFNTGYHVMIMVIAASTTIEYTLKGGYEILIGRITELTSANAITEEDQFNAKVSQDYVDFIRVRPWYEYNFLAQLQSLWKDTTFYGPHMLRKLERKYLLTSEYLAKALYGWVIMKATKAGYDAESMVTAVIVDRLPANIQSSLPAVKTIKTFENGTVLVTVPRYQAFTDYALGFAQQQIQLQEIAGNNSQILLSVLTPSTWQPAAWQLNRLFMQPILTRPEQKREILLVPVADLSPVLKRMADAGFVIEHIYDY